MDDYLRLHTKKAAHMQAAFYLLRGGLLRAVC